MIKYRHVDVFTKQPLSGNGLTVFFPKENTSTELMQKITTEMRQFESIFLFPTEKDHMFRAKIFTVEEELDFAGHPLIGAACVLHEKLLSHTDEGNWIFLLNNKKVPMTSRAHEKYFSSTMDQGVPTFNKPLTRDESLPFLEALNLSSVNASTDLPLQTVSTGLPYLIISLKSGLEKSRIVHHDFEELLKTVGAKFAYVFDENTFEARSWDNKGAVEDVATGSAAGPLGAYLCKQNRASFEKPIVIKQGKYVNRPSEIRVTIDGSNEKISSVKVSGDVCMISKGILDFDLCN